MSIASLFAARERVEALVADYQKEPAFLLIANPVGTPRDAMRLIALFDTADLARAYEVASLMPREDRGGVIAGKPRIYVSSSLLFDCTRGVYEPGRAMTPAQSVAEMVGPLLHPFRFDGIEELPWNPVVSGGDDSAEREVAETDAPDGAVLQ